jgi:DNA-binding FadR family transcriptional regulator
LCENDLDILNQLVSQMQTRADAGKAFEQEDYEFHELLYRRCNNPLALELFEITWRVRTAALDQSRALHEIPPGTVSDHRKLVAALRAQDVARAQALIVAHHANVERRFQKAIVNKQAEMVED